MAVVNEIHYKRDEHPACPCVDERLDKQAEDLKELKKNLDRNFASISEQLRRLSADIVRHDERLKTHIESPGGVDNLLESKCNASWYNIAYLIRYELKPLVQDFL